MKLKFTKDYTGRETAMKPYKAGEQAEIPTSQALELVRLGVAREVWAEIGRLYDPPKPAPEVAPEVAPEPPAVVEAQPVKKPRKGKGKAK